MALIVNVHEAKSSLSKLLEAVERGERVTIARAGKPVVDLVVHQGVDLVFGLGKGEISFFDEEPFDEPVDDLISAFDGAIDGAVDGA